MPKHFVLEERLERYADAIETHPAAYAGRWAEACWPLGAPSGNGDRAPASGAGHGEAAREQSRYQRVFLDLGCGKGAYLVEMARREPDALFIGVDGEPVCIAYAAQHILEAGVRNALAVPGRAEQLPAMFAPGELSGISLNFPTPAPKRRQAHTRLVTAEHLALLRPLLALGAALTFRTDNEPLFAYALPQFETAGFALLWTSRDDRAEHPDVPLTEYEARMAAEGARVLALGAVPTGPAPTPERLQAARELPQSLYDYLPDDLFEGGYTPHGMGYGVTNLRRAKMRRQAAAWREPAAGTSAGAAGAASAASTSSLAEAPSAAAEPAPAPGTAAGSGELPPIA